MSEEHATYLTLAHELNALDRRDGIMNDPNASDWLKRAVTELWERDVMDALNDLDVLRELLEAKHLSARHLAATHRIEEHTTDDENNSLWVAGWMWGKYPEHAATYPLPQNATEVREWWEGFRWGATESAQFHRIWEWLDETLAGHDAAIELVKSVAGE